MPDCTDRNEQVMLDVYGELDAGARSAWEDHLRTCADCRREKENLTAMLGQVREAMAPQPLSMQDSTAMIRKVQDRLAVFRLPGGRAAVRQRKTGAVDSGPCDRLRPCPRGDLCRLRTLRHDRCNRWSRELTFRRNCRKMRKRLSKTWTC